MTKPVLGTDGNVTRVGRAEADMSDGRKSYVIARALHVAIKVLGDLPPDQRPYSDIDDMRALLAQTPGLVFTFRIQDDMCAALAKLPANATDEDRECTMRAVLTEWGATWCAP